MTPTLNVTPHIRSLISMVVTTTFLRPVQEQAGFQTQMGLYLGCDSYGKCRFSLEEADGKTSMSSNSLCAPGKLPKHPPGRRDVS